MDIDTLRKAFVVIYKKRRSENLKEKVNIMVLHHNIHIKLQKERKYVVLASKNIIQVYMKTNLNKAMAKTRIDEISLFEKCHIYLIIQLVSVHM